MLQKKGRKSTSKALAMGFSTFKSPALLFIVISTIFLSVSIAETPVAGGNRKLIGESTSEYRVVSKVSGPSILV
ncbi:hypothetical protein HPP92_025558 [Vanilla planifolia]|uniref:Uncharacterized protein n=1 Tax=Vanilla planifolia TaxID=51239 RepID=A0A835PJF8_VANPL|nr:hypothetical protein HPP92_025558 [Vanilla planifolia]